MTKPRRRFAFSIGTLLAALVAGCSGDVVLPDEGEAADLQIVSGDEQLGPAGNTLPQQVVVRVLDTRERPVANQDVTFTIGSGGGTVEPATVKSDAMGQAAASWTLGPNAGGHLLRAQTPSGGSGTLEETFRATAVAGSGSVLIGAGGDDQTGPVSSALADSLVVQATDVLGNPVAGVEVTWSVSGGGSISPTTVVTGADGLAGAERVLGPTAGPQSAQATVDGFTGSPVTFTHTAVPANPTALVKVSGDAQTAPGGFEVAEDLVVRLEDDNGNGIGGRAITWVVPANSGSVSPVNTTTNANGLATTRWTLPSAVGGYGVSAVFSGLPAVPFTGTATADVPTTIALVSGNNQQAAVGASLPNPLVVRVTDANDNPVAGVSVNWTAEVGGSVSAPTSGTDASGLAEITRTLGAVPGPHPTTASVEGLSGSVTFNSTATVGPPAQLRIITQPGSPTISGSAFSPAPVVQVQDAQGNAVPQGGIEVVASITSGQAGASLVNAERNTNSTGRAVFTNLRITGPPDDAYVLTFTAATDDGPLASVSSVELTVITGAANTIVIIQEPSSTAQNGAVFAQQPQVRVEDGSGNPVTGDRTIEVELGQGAGDGTLSGTLTASTNGGATATFTGLRITGDARSYTLIFSSTVLAPDESNPIAITAGPPASIAIEDGDGQSAPVGTAVATAPSVIVTDASGNPVPDVNVDFNVAPGSGSVDPGTVATGSNGIAAVNSWTLGPAAGANTLTASVPSAPALGTEVFTATGTVNNQAPTAQDDNNPAYTVEEDGALNITAAEDRVLFNDSDPDGDNLTAVNASNPPGGTVVLSSNGGFTYTPDADFNGTDTFTYQANDGLANSNTATVTITVTPVNDPPSFQVGADQTVSASNGAVTVPGWATGIVPGPLNESSQTVTFQVSTDNDAAFTALPQVDPLGTLNYTPEPLALGVVTVTVTAFDGLATSDPQTFTITIVP